MIKLIGLSHQEEWDSVVRSFPNYDVYYLSGYVKPFMLHGDGVPCLLFAKEDTWKAIYVFMKRETFVEGVYDAITPYGYGGVLFDGSYTQKDLQNFWESFNKIMKGEGIIDNFVRYHPVLNNAPLARDYTSVIDLGKTIAIDLSSPDDIWNNMTSKKRGKIRKAEKNGIEIHHGQGLDLFREFLPIYNATMEKDEATDYYFFEMPFYEAIHEELRDHYEMFYATLEGKIIMMAIMLHCNGQMHYHLSGSLLEYRNLEPNNLLLYKAALWGYEHGLKTLHLGGGVGSADDPLYTFKAGFNRNSDYQFSIGKQIIDLDKYNGLVRIKKEENPLFDESSSFFPLYRSEQRIVVSC
jgi:hypothetical protein